MRVRSIIHFGGLATLPVALLWSLIAWLGLDAASAIAATVIVALALYDLVVRPRLARRRTLAF